MSDACEMKISKLIELLQTAQSTYGDLPVTTGHGRLRGARVIVARDGNVWSVPNCAQNELKVELGEDAAQAEITRLRSQVEEQEATIRRLQDRASKDAETFSALKREAVEAEREACARIAREGCLVPPDGGSPTEEERIMCEGIATAIRNRTEGVE